MINNDNQYKELIDKVNGISSITTKENSILYDFKIEDDYLKSKILLVDQNGNQEVLDDRMINIKNKFQTFFSSLIKNFCENNEIAFTDRSDTDGDNLITYRFVTADNDLLTIDGLTFGDTSFIRDYVDSLELDVDKDSKVLKKKNNTGAIDAWLVFAIISIIVLVLCIIYLI